MLILIFPTKKCPVDSFWTFFKYLGKQSELKKTKTPKNFIHAGISF